MPVKHDRLEKISVPLLERIAAESTGLGMEGSVASYIPELARAPRDVFSVSCVTCGGGLFEFGGIEYVFTMQSISKVFALALALEKIGAEAVFASVAMDPSSDAFNSITHLEKLPHKPSNPFINAGAIAINAMLFQKFGADSFDEVCRLVEDLTGTYRGFDADVYRSESATADRNRALAYFMKSTGYLSGNEEDFLQLYFKSCSISCTTKDLAKAAAVLARGGRGADGRQVLSKETVHTLLGLMSVCGLYNGSGEFAVRTGLSGKSGVSGGIVAVAPGSMGIGVFSPVLDERGNSIVGVRIIEKLSGALDLRGLYGRP